VGPRAAFSQVLIAGAFVLLVAIGVGIGMGNHVLGQVAGREPIAPTPVPIPTPKAGDPVGSSAWKRTSVISVATDPGFPDPRVTPEPEVKPTPKRTPTPKPSPTPNPFAEPTAPYTSPPLPVPMGTSSSPAEPQVEPSAAGRPVGAPHAATSRPATLPPVPVPSFNNP
jgi:hypothetical protein